MGVIDRIIGASGTITAVGATAQNMAEIFTQNQTRRMELDEEAHARALAQHGAEFEAPRPGMFDGFVNGLNRLPRPLLTLATLSLFGYSMVHPEGFAARMAGLELVPEPLWWLMGAIVSFYFGAREAHYFRARSNAGRSAAPPAREAREAQPAAGAFDDNPALADWAASR